MVSLKLFETGYEKLFTYYRILDQEKYRFVLNFSAEKINLSPEILATGSHRIIGNYEQTESGTVLPWEANLYQV